MGRYYRTETEQRGYDAYSDRHHGASKYDGNWDYENGWEEARREEVREQEREEEERQRLDEEEARQLRREQKAEEDAYYARMEEEIRQEEELQ